MLACVCMDGCVCVKVCVRMRARACVFISTRIAPLSPHSMAKANHHHSIAPLPATITRHRTPSNSMATITHHRTPTMATITHHRTPIIATITHRRTPSMATITHHRTPSMATATHHRSIAPPFAGTAGASRGQAGCCKRACGRSREQGKLLDGLIKHAQSLSMM